MANPAPHLPRWLRRRPRGQFGDGTRRYSRRFYWRNFANLGLLEVVPGRLNTRELMFRDEYFSHIEWFRNSTIPAQRVLGRTLGDFQRQHLHSPAHPLRVDIAVYDFCCLAICRLPGNEFDFETMKGLYYFLLHMQRLDARRYVRSITINDMTTGPCVRWATQLIPRLRGLRRMHLGLCPACGETNCDPATWQLWRNVRGFNHMAPTAFRFFYRTNGERCEACKRLAPQPVAHRTRSRVNAAPAPPGFLAFALGGQIPLRTALIASLQRPL